MHEHDPERKADDGAEPEADDRFLGGEERLVQQHGDQRRLVDLHRLSERLEDRPQVRHRGRVDDERPAPSGRRPDPPIQLPEAGEREDDRDNGCDSAGDPRRLPRAQRTARGRAGDGGGGHRLLLITYFVGSIAMALDPSRTVAELKELRELTGDENGAQRVAWTDTWERAREWLRGKVAETGAREEIDEAGNQWFTLRGDSDEALLLGGHIDSVPNGGWLDGCLNVLAGVEVLRRIAEDGTPPLTLRLVNWADEEGARFGRSLFGSSAAAGSMADQEELRQRHDANGIALPDALREHGVDLDRVLDARAQLENAAAYLELHIEQGPVLESLDLPLGVVLGTFGVERHLVTWTGQAAHAGSTPMDRRRDALAGASKLALEIRPIAAEVGDGAVCTSGGVVCRPGIVTSVVEKAEQLLDQRHLDAAKLAWLLELAQEASERFAREEDVEVSWKRIWK